MFGGCLVCREVTLLPGGNAIQSRHRSPSVTMAPRVEESRRSVIQMGYLFLSTRYDMVEHRRGTTNEAPDALSRMFDVDVDPLGWEKVVEEAIQGRIQLNSICDQNWYDTKFKLVSTQPDKFTEWKIERDELFYYRPDYEKALIDDENPWKKVVKPMKS